MPSTLPGIIALDGVEYAIVDNTYIKEVQTPFNNRFSTGDPGTGDLSFFQFLAMDDFSGGNGQVIFTIPNQFLQSDGVDVTTPPELAKPLMLAPKMALVANINGPQHEHLDEPIEDEDAWPQIIEWLGKAVIFNDRVEFDAGGVDFLDVYETDVTKNQVINRDTTGTAGIKTADTHAKIIDITAVDGLPGDVFKVTAQFSKLSLKLIGKYNDQGGTSAIIQPLRDQIEISFRLYFGGDDARQSTFYSEVKQKFSTILFSYSTPPLAFPLPANFFYTTIIMTNEQPIVEFTVRIPDMPPGVYNLFTSAEFDVDSGPTAQLGKSNPPPTLYADWISNRYYVDDLSNAKVLFFIDSSTNVVVTRKNLYAPQLKAACVYGDKLIGGRVFDGIAYIEVYQEQNGAVDRTLQIKLTADSSIPNPPTYMHLIASDDIIVAAFDNKIYKIDILTANLTDAQRITGIGTVPGTYVSGMEIWNQRVYIGSFDKSQFSSFISWTNLSVIQSSYAIDGKFWITDLATFNGALFYSGGTQNGEGQVRAFPSSLILRFNHPQFDNRVRCLNAGSRLYAGWSHGTGLGVITDRGASSWAKVDLGEESTNVVWDIEEVGNTVFMLAGNGLYKTTDRYFNSGSLETSEMGANTPLIDKDWASVTVDLVQALLGSHKVKIWASNAGNPDNFYLLGELNSASALSTDLFFPPSFSSPWIKLLIELSTTDDQTTPIVKKITIKYVPQSLNKLQWTFGVRAYDNIDLLNGQRDGRKGADIMASLFTLPARGNINFRDIDDNAYQVTISDMKQTNPIINKKSLEGLVMVELLEL